MSQRSSSGNTVVVYAALAANLAVAIAKFVAAAATGSAAMLAEGIHSVSDSGNEILLLIGVRRARRPPTSRHPFGHGKELYFWGLIVAMLVFSVGGGMSIVESILRWRSHEVTQDAGWSYVILAIAFALELGSLVVGVRKLLAARAGRTLFTTWRESKDPTVFTVVAEDAASLVGVSFAFSGIFLSRATGKAFFDPLASLLIGVLLIVVSLMLVWENRGLLIGESARAPLVEGVRAILARDRAVRAVGPLLTMHLGPREVLLDADLDFVPALSLEELRATIVRLEKAIQRAYPIITRIYIEAASFSREGGAQTSTRTSAERPSDDRSAGS